MKKVRFVATIYKQEPQSFQDSFILLPSEVMKREIKTRKVSDKEMAKIMRLKAKLIKMGNPWERKRKREEKESSEDK